MTPEPDIEKLREEIVTIVFAHSGDDTTLGEARYIADRILDLEPIRDRLSLQPIQVQPTRESEREAPPSSAPQT